MSSTTLKKNRKGYNYQYTDLAEIHEYLEEQGYSYYQYIEPLDGVDYVFTVKKKDGKDSAPIRGARVVATAGKNSTQEYGKALTYARRYSLLLAFGLCTTDNDAADWRNFTPQKNSPLPTEVPVPYNPQSRGDVGTDYMSNARSIFVQRIGQNAPVEYLSWLKNVKGKSWEEICDHVANNSNLKFEVDEWKAGNNNG